MLASPYPILEDWDTFTSAYQREIAKEMFLRNIIRGDTPQNVDMRWENTTETNRLRAERALDSQAFDNFQLNVEPQKQSGWSVTIRAHADYVTQNGDTELVSKRLIYTASIAIYRQEGDVVAELTTVNLEQ